ncbi:hypothetical protein [Ruegeria sp. HKCCA0235A]|uniref:hypothetical protein n=1 Tax=Ruegeria sp. HKCCA0235A TaxID=2682998 RepID=UPI001488F7DD|nr:hypothetical protein [Ruegeria sp. HKCCA0235A]
MSYLEIWKQSHWLSKSAEAFAAHFFKEEWVAAQDLRGDKHWLEVFGDAMAQASTEVADGWERAQIGAQKLSEISTPKLELKRRATDEIVKLLRKGVYRAYGFDRPRTLDLEPVQIPQEAWNERFAFEKNEVHHQSLRFIDVRVRMMSAENDPLLKAQPYPVPAKAGRPSIKEDVEAAFRVLAAQEQIDVSLPAKANIDRVRQQMRVAHPQKYPLADKPGYEGIRPHFSPLFEDLKNARKQ